ncbi:zonadhesin-like [Oratosquilla oratoria]|uniref:zonadhesin-like n=1 Tax=Oratosquilla oratoria TaxID=337810 RepID=UPI003F7579B5
MRRGDASHVLLARTLLVVVLLTKGKVVQAVDGPDAVQRLLWTLRKAVKEGPGEGAAANLHHYQTFSCNARHDALYPDLPSGCNVYYRCLSGVVYSYVCPAGERLDYEKQQCLPDDYVSCPSEPPSTPPCFSHADGFYPNYTDACRSYYRCADGKLAWRGQCDGSKTFDVATGSCGNGPRVGCSPPSCWGLPDGRHPTQGSSCTSYFTCSNGVRTDQRCPTGSIFDYGTKTCVRSGSAVCYEGACKGRVNGRHAITYAPCNVYMECFNGAMVSLEDCPSGQVFDGQDCVDNSSFVCWKEDRMSCEDRMDGLYPVADTGCQGFYRCRNQQLIRAFKCASGLIFNGEECVDDQNFICPLRPRAPDCTNKLDGYYTVEKSECKSFFYCRGGSKVSDHSCPGTHVFNGQQCVDPLLYPCPPQVGSSSRSHEDSGSSQNRPLQWTMPHSRATREVECTTRPDGYYLDVNSRCTRFFFCKGGQREFTQSCPSGHVFTGARCVPESQYDCPVITDAPECAIRETGVYPNLVHGCRTYFHCIARVMVTYKCPEGTLHDGKTCSPPSQVFCPSPSLCLGHPDGTFPDTARQCQGYFSCVNETVISYRTCPLGQAFDGQKCVSHLPHVCPSVPGNDCASRKDGWYQDLASGCVGYYRCKEQSRTETRRCAGGLVFNKHVCVPKAQYACPTAGSDLCKTNQRGFFADLKSGCRRYYYCSNGRSVFAECPSDGVFNGRTCVSPKSYKCPSTSICEEPDGLYTDYASHCRRYYRCRQGARTNFTCPDGELHNGEKCVSGKSYSCPATFSCRGKADGFYQDLLSGCKDYFYCYAETKFEYSCPSRQVFNGRTCVSGSSYACPSVAAGQECRGKLDGVYADLSTRCQKYFVCRSQTKLLSLSCTSGLVFNGIACVPPSVYACPYGDVQTYSVWTVLSLPLKNLKPNTTLPKGHETGGLQAGNLISASTEAKPTGHEVHGDPETLRGSLQGNHTQETSSRLFPDSYNANTGSAKNSSVLVEGDDSGETDEDLGDVSGLATHTVTAESTGLSMDCRSLPVGRYADVRSRCQKFLECSAEGTGTLYLCSKDHVFSPVTGACEPHGQVPCPSSNPCKELSDGLYAESESSCRVYFACKDRSLALAAICPMGKSFDERLRSCVDSPSEGCPAKERGADGGTGGELTSVG